MIPKIVHYCWLSNDPYPVDIERCICSWKKYLPDYELRLWNMSSFGDNCPAWVTEAFQNRKYAFAADYVRAYALYNYGGIYLDSDVEVLKSFDTFLDLPYILGRETCSTYGKAIEAACIGAEPRHPFFGALLQYYRNRNFVKEDGSLDQLPLPMVFNKVISGRFNVLDIKLRSEFNYSKEVLCVFPNDYFSPKNLKNQRITVTENTVAIHHFAGSWQPWRKRWTQSVQKFLGPDLTDMIQSLKSRICKS